MFAALQSPEIDDLATRFFDFLFPLEHSRFIFLLPSSIFSMDEPHSDPHPQKTDLSQKSDVIPRHRSSLSIETDLWNLDEELPTAREVASAEQVTARNASEEEPIVRMKKGTVNRALPPVTPLSTILGQEISPKPRESEIASPDKAKVEQPSRSSKKPQKSVGLTEEAIWDDNDFDYSAAQTTELSDAVPTPIVESVVETKRQPDAYREEPIAIAAKITPQPVAEAPEIREEIVATTFEDTLAPSTAEGDQFDREAASSAPSSEAPSLQIQKFSGFEKIASLAFLALLIGGAFLGLHLFRSNVQAQVDPYAMPDFPIKGSIAQVDKIKTYWRAPIREGPDADPTQRDVTLIPVIDITIDDTISKSGVLRVIFYNETGTITGDIITREFSNNRFEKNGSSTLSFSSTSGFSSFGEQEAYRANLGKPWSIKVFEGPHADAPSSSFLLLFSTPISTERK